MLKAELSLFFILIVSSVYCFPTSDTLNIKSQSFNVRIDHAIIASGKDLNIDKINEYAFLKKELPFNSKGNVILSKLINYEGKAEVEVILEPLGYHYVDVYLKNTTNGETTVNKTGQLLGYPENEMFETKSKINKVKLHFLPEHTYELIIVYRNSTQENIQIAVSLADADTWQNRLYEKSSSLNFWLGIFFGTLILLSLVNFIFYYLFRDRTYMVYVGYIISILIYESLLFGYFDSTWIKYKPELLPLLINISLILFIIFYLLFLRAFINLKKNYPRWNNLLYYVILFLIILMVSTNILFFIERPISGYSYRNIGLLFIIPIVIVFLSNVILSKRLIDRVFFTGSIFLVLSGLLSIITYLNNNYDNSDIYLQAGILIELIIFNIGLGLRSKIIQNEKDEELHKLILKLKVSEENQKNLNASLEDKVEERTQQINEINQELTTQRDQLFDQKEIIEQNLEELNDVRKNLVKTVSQKTKELRQANKELVAQNAQLEQYAFITAHNLKAPVARLKGLVNIFELTNQSSDPNNELVYRIKEASLDMDEVISDINKILQIKNFNQQGRKNVNLENLINKIKKRLEGRIIENKIRITTDLQIETIQSIDTYMESILYNLIYNGIKYSREDVDAFIRIQSYHKNNHVYLEIEDNGIGIDLERFGEKIFGLYQRFHDHVNGKGIGLYLVKTQVEALRGKIFIESNVDKGTTFKLFLPKS